MKRKNKLPRYWLGTRMPTSLGYQLPNHNSGETVTSTPGLSITPQVNSIYKNAIPSSLNKLTNTSSYALNALKYTTTPAIASTSATINSAAINNAAVGGVAARLASPGAGTNYMGSMFTVNGTNALEQGGEKVAGQVAAKTGLSTLGKVTAGIGTAYGLYDMGDQLLHNKDYMSSGEMRNMLTRNEYTTEGGNKYVRYSGLDRGAIERHAKAERLKRNLNFTATSIGTGMSAGALIGGSVGSVAPGVGTAIGAGVGALAGGAAYLFGLGNIQEKEKLAANVLNDAINMEGRLSESIARSNDIKQGFYDRTNSGIARAALGKFPIFGEGKGNAYLSNGEIHGNLREGWEYLLGGIPNNDDTNLRHVKKDDYIIRNALVPFYKATGDLPTTLAIQDAMNKNNKEYKNLNLKLHAKCGKLPKYDIGKPWLDGALIAGPHIGAMLANLELYNRLKNASTYTPLEPLESEYGNTIASLMEGDLIPIEPFLKDSWKAYREALWNNNRQTVLGPGGRAIGAANLYRNLLDHQGAVRKNIWEANRNLRNSARELRFKNYLNLMNLKHDSWWKRENEMLAKQGSINNLMALIPLNLYNINSSLSKGLLANSQHVDAMDIAKELNAIYRSKVNNDNYIAQLLAKWLGNNTAIAAPAMTSTTTTPSIASTNINIPQILLNNPDFLRMIDQLNYSGR